MLSLLIIAVTTCLSTVQAGIDYNDCLEYRGSFGDTVSCTGGYLPVMVCSSGRDADCENTFTILRCCRETLGTGGKETKACDVLSGRYGEYLECASQKVTLAVCTSGRDANCGGDAHTRINCCDGKCLFSRDINSTYK